MIGRNNKPTMIGAASAVLLVLIFGNVVHAENWPRFRGPNGTGISQDKDIPVEWNEKNILWKTSLPGSGHSSPIIWGDKLFLQNSGADGKQRTMVCIDVANGKILWETPVSGTTAKTHAKNSLASATPTTDGKLVYGIFWDGKKLHAAAFDFKGKEVWKTGLGDYSSQHGPGHSPIVHDGKVFYANDQDELARLVALNAADGKVAWEKERKAFRASYSTPFLLERSDGSVEMIVTSSSGVTSYKPATGDVLWDYTWKFDAAVMRTVASSILTQGLVIAGSGNGEGGRHTIAVKADGKGDVTSTNLSWESKEKDLAYVPCLLAHGDFIFSANDKGLALCHRTKTGEEVWKNRLGGNVSASPIMIQNRIYAVDEKGDVFVFAAEEKFKLLAKNSMGEGVMASPAVADDKLYIRGKEHLFCIGKSR